MDATATAGRYFEAWNARDPDAIAAVLAEDGTYSDPAVPQGLDPQATAAYAAGLFAAFPDLAFDVDDLTSGDDGRVWARWLMTGTNTGPFSGLPPTGRRVSLPGADLVRVREDRVAEVHGFFDSAGVPRQLGMQVIVQPDVVGPFRFGVSTYVAKASTEPGAVSLTVVEARSEQEQEQVRALSRETVGELVDAPGFISWLGVTAGNRMYTITAWETAEDVAVMRSTPPHVEAMRRFFGAELAAGGQTGVWTPHRLNGMWVRCAECGAMAKAADGRCTSGHELPEAPAYW